jgi:hypothetical protein
MSFPVPLIEPRRCQVCGCTEFEACVDEHGGRCCWVKADLCSHCVIRGESVGLPENDPSAAAGVVLAEALAEWQAATGQEQLDESLVDFAAFFCGAGFAGGLQYAQRHFVAMPEPSSQLIIPGM